MSRFPGPVRPPPPPPPPPPCPDHWPGRTGRTLLEHQGSNFWPHRLLYVPSMTSYVREGPDTYNGVSAPQYNVLSYTWGNFLDPTEIAISVNGVDWPIPAIRKGHFTADNFKTAIGRAASGVKYRCEWLWVDIACIPQKHENETEMARIVRGQEIGRQVDIFRRAQETFAWLSHMKTSELCESQRFMNIDHFLDYANKGISIRGAEDANSYLNTCENKFRLFETWMSKFLSHPWLSSLWTLQEMILRQDAWVLFDDGLINLYHGDKDTSWNFVQIKNDVYCLRSISSGRLVETLKNAESIAVSGNFKSHKGSADRIRKRFERLLEIQILKGLDALTVGIPNTAYSAARYRNATELIDRIYGIVQIYDISCDPDPAGEDETAKLDALEDEFGAKLIAKSSLLSQIFIHSSEEPPRRTWLITQNCIVDHFWGGFFMSQNIVNELGSLKFLDETRNIQFHGKAWYLDSFFESKDDHLFKSKPGLPENYVGLILDYHVSKQVLGQVVDYFDSRERMLQAVQRLHKYYGKPSRIALLGSGSFPRTPVVRYVGVVLAPLDNIKGNAEWIRIGLVRWIEVYTIDASLAHYHLPDYRDFQCVIT